MYIKIKVHTSAELDKRLRGSNAFMHTSMLVVYIII